jgi:hypothetical protein
MAVSKLGEPFQGEAWYWVEDTFGAGESATTLPISKKILSMRMSTGDRQTPLRGIDSPLACYLLPQAHTPKFTVEYIPQAGDTLLDDVVDRGSCCTLQSLAYMVTANKCSTGDDVSYFYVVGAKANSVTITGAQSEPYKVSIEHLCKQISTPSDVVGSAPTALAGTFMAFNVAGEITKTGGVVVDTDHIAYITNSISVTITHGVEAYVDHNSLYASFMTEGEMGIEGSVDISLDGGGALHFDEALANTDFTITINMGDVAGSPIITLPGSQWKNSEVELNLDGKAMMESAPFISKPTLCGALVSAVAGP